MKLKSQDEHFTELVGDSRASIEKYITHQKALEGSLIEQSNLASLQGVRKRAKSTTYEYQHICQEWYTKLQVVAEEEPAALTDSNRKFIESCVTFENGGDYDAKEIDLSRRSLAKVDSRVRDVSKARTEVYTQVNYI